MRTAVTRDPDLLAKLRTLARERGVSFKEALKRPLGLGMSGPPNKRGPHRLATRRLTLRAGIDLEHALRVAGELENAEIIRKLEVRK